MSLEVRTEDWSRNNTTTSSPDRRLDQPQPSSGTLLGWRATSGLSESKPNLSASSRASKGEALKCRFLAISLCSLLVFLTVPPWKMSPLWRPPSILCINVNSELFKHNMAEDSLHKRPVTFFQRRRFTFKNSRMSRAFPQSCCGPPRCYLTNRFSCVSFPCLFLQH